MVPPPVEFIERVRGASSPMIIRGWTTSCAPPRVLAITKRVVGEMSLLRDLVDYEVATLVETGTRLGLEWGGEWRISSWSPWLKATSLRLTNR